MKENVLIIKEKVSKIIDIKTIIIVVLLVLLALSWGKKPNSIGDSVNIIDSITWNVKDSLIIKDTIVYNQKDTIVPHYVTIPVYDTLGIDTNEIVRDYFSKQHYQDTLVNDAELFFTLNEDVYRNRITGRTFSYVNKLPKYKVKTKTVYRSKSVYKAKFYVGGNITTTGGFYIGGLYTTPHKGAYNVTYDPINKNFNLGVYFKLF